MTTLMKDISRTIFKRAKHTKLSEFATDLKAFNILGAIDGKRTIGEIASQHRFDLQYLEEKVQVFYDQGLIEKVGGDNLSRGQAKKILDAIIERRSRGVGSIAKALKIKLALKGINPDKLTSDTPDDPILLKRLVELARSYGLQVRINKADSPGPEQTQGKTKLILDSIITQRSGGNPAIAKAIKAKLMLKGINPDVYSLDTADDPAMVKKLIDLAGKLGVTIPAASATVDDAIENFL